MATLFDPLPKQKEFLEIVFSFKHKYLLTGGGIGGGKSFATMGTMLTLLFVYPGSKGICVRDSFPNLKLSSIESWKKLIHNQIGPNSFITSYNQTEQIFTCANGSQIQFLAEDATGKPDLAHFFGLEFNWAILEECSTLQYATYLKILERCGRWIPENGKVLPPCIMLTCNPCNNWIRDIFYDKYIEGNLGKDYFYLPTLITDNKYLTENTAYMESVKQMPSVQYRRYILGDWNIEEPAEGRIYRSFDPDKIISSVKYNPALPLHISFDENINPFMTCVVFQVVLEKDATGKTIKKNIHVVDEILGRHPMNSCEGISTLFKKKFSTHSSGLLIYGDATSLKRDGKIEHGMSFYSLIIGYLKQYKPILRVLKSNPSVILRCAFFDAIFEKQFGGINFLIDAHCNETVNDFLSTQSDSDGTKLKNLVRDPKSKVSYQAHGHLSDACDYFLVSAFANEYAQFQYGGRKPADVSWGRNPATRSSYDSPNSYRPPLRTSRNDYQ